MHMCVCGSDVGIMSSSIALTLFSETRSFTKPWAHWPMSGHCLLNSGIIEVYLSSHLFTGVLGTQTQVHMLTEQALQ